MSGPKAKSPRRSPAMEQFFRAKAEYPDALLFFRMGDFYEMFFEDAVLASQLLDLTLTSRGADVDGVAIPMAGVPHHAASGYIARLLEQGQRVAICEQMEDPSKVKGIVPRAVVRIVTPALVLDPDALDARVSNYLVALRRRDDRIGLAVLELGANELRAVALPSDAAALAELMRASPRELLAYGLSEAFIVDIQRMLPRAAIRVLTDDRLDTARAHPSVASTLQRSDLELGASALDAAALALKYAIDAQPGTPFEVERVEPYDPSCHLTLDEAAVRNLELVSTLGGERRGSLLHALDTTQTPMGARLLRSRLLAPLSQVEPIRQRHERVQTLVEHASLRQSLRRELAEIGDLERLATRTALGVATPRDLGAIRAGLRQCAKLQSLLRESPLAAGAPADVCDDVHDMLQTSLLDELPLASNQGGIFRDAFDPRVAELRELGSSSKDVILRLEEKERTRTGIASLKIRYTKVFGYYIEISRAKAGAVPEDYRRKQTVAGGERYTTEEIETVQAKILNADERVRALEAELFVELRKRVGAHAPRLRALAQACADLDVHANFAEVAHRHDFVRPDLDESLGLELVQLRHPVVERMLARGSFVPNDVHLDAERARLMIITGPNMAGKSTSMRQVALAVLLAQAGGFVPAKRASIGVVDRIYTRVGASDNLAAGQSTFMVEMTETAQILRGATKRSLVILDEIGRGTSTYDGLSLAWAIAEHLHDAIGCRAMFATHYHELCELAELREGVVNYNVTAKEHGEHVVFLHQLAPGSANRSYGVAVARLAGVPEIVLARARAILQQLEGSAAGAPYVHAKPGQATARTSPQLDMFSGTPAPQADSPAEATLREIDVDRMTPIDALNALARLKAMLPPKS